jgi:hypothetical protein
MLVVNQLQTQETFWEAPGKPLSGISVVESPYDPYATDTIVVQKVVAGAGGYVNFAYDPNVQYYSPTSGEIELTGTYADLTYVLQNTVLTPYGQGDTQTVITDTDGTGGVTINAWDLDPVKGSMNHPNDLASSGDVTGPHNYIDAPNLEAGYADLRAAFGTNQAAMQGWVNTRELIEGRPELFDGLDYVASYGDLTNAYRSGSQHAVLDAGAEHYIAYGANEGRQTSFNSLDYIASYSDLINAFGTNGDAGAYHYIEHGSLEGRTTTFDGLEYVASYGDLTQAYARTTPETNVAQVEQDGAEHYISNGHNEGRTTTFDGFSYIAANPDLMVAFGSNKDAGAEHWLYHGLFESRAESFNVGAYESAHPDLIGKFATNDDFLAAYITTYQKTGTFLV